MKLVICALAVLIASTLSVQAQTANTDEDAIKATALNYIEGWYEGDAARMESALHPELAKRMISTDPKPAAASSITWAPCSWSRTLGMAAATGRQRTSS